MRKALWLCGGLLALAASVSGATILLPGVPATGTIEGEQHLAFTITAQAGNRVAVTLEQQGSDLVMKVIEPQGRSWDVDDQGGPSGHETAFWIAEAAGEFRIEIGLSSGVAGKSAKYELRCEPFRPASEEDRVRAQAARAHADATALRITPKADSRRQALVE